MAITIAVVGLGLRGRQWVDALRRTPGYELAACVDVEGTVLQKAAAALGIPDGRCFVRLEDALDDTRPQAVIVASSIDNHVLPSRTVLARRIPLLVEKPFALTLREARSLAALAADAGVPLVVGQTYRYTGMAQTLKRFLGTGALGRTGLVVYQVYRGNTYMRAAVAALPHGVLWETGVHHIDLRRRCGSSASGAPCSPGAAGSSSPVRVGSRGSWASPPILSPSEHCSRSWRAPSRRGRLRSAARRITSEPWPF